VFIAAPSVRAAKPAWTPMIAVSFRGYVRSACGCAIDSKISDAAWPERFVFSLDRAALIHGDTAEITCLTIVDCRSAEPAGCRESDYRRRGG